MLRSIILCIRLSGSHVEVRLIGCDGLDEAEVRNMSSSNTGVVERVEAALRDAVGPPLKFKAV